MHSLGRWALRSGSSVTASAGRPVRWPVALVYAFCTIAFVADITRMNELAYGVFYIPLIATALLHRRRHGLWVLVTVAIAMVVIGAFLPVVNADLPDLVGNRILSVIAILATACFVDQARRIQERLRTAQRRAEAAEQVKGEVLANLSEEMRTPLHTLLSLMNLMLPGARPDQTEALLRIRSSGQHLLGTINNLIDLAQLDDRTFHPVRIELGRIAAEAAAKVAAYAIDRGIAVHCTASPPAWVMADPWATGRIMENLLAYLIQTSPDGETLTVSLRQQDGNVQALLLTGTMDAAAGAAARETPQQKAPQPWGTPPESGRKPDPADATDAGHDSSGLGSAGLTLADRLTQLMGGKLEMPPEPGTQRFHPPGTAIRLSLPAA